MISLWELIIHTQVIVVEQIGVSYLCNDNFLCILNMHVIYQFRMLQNRLLDLWKIIDRQTNKTDYTERCYAALKKCIRKHQSLIEFCDKLEYVYTLPIFGHMVVFSLLMCFDSYEILLVCVNSFVFVFK